MTDATPAPSNGNNIIRNRWIKRLGAVFLIIGFIYFVYWAFLGRFYESTDDAYVSGNLIQVMPQITGQVTTIMADETDLVTKGEPIIYLDKVDAELALNNAEAKLALTARQVSMLYHQANQLQANVELQKANLERAKADYARRLGLVVTKYISKEDLQHSKLTMDAATARLDLAKQQLSSAIAQVANSDLYHHPQIQQAAEAVRDAYLAYQRTTIFAPDTGYVAKRPVEVGEQVNPNTILMIIVPLNQVWVDANFKESQLKNMRIGQPVEVISDVYGNDVKYKGKIVGLSPGAGDTFDLLPPQNATGNWIKIVQRLPVRIAIDPEQLKKYPLRLGLSITATADTYHQGGSSLQSVSDKKIIYQTQDYSADLHKADEMIQSILKANANDETYPSSTH